ncbi:MAG: dihydroorotase [Gammaproteobacteria bacterium]|nr:dihydroorotase [Gammaproteobacteria bacterium]MCY4228278.1 dihydroorotase [Gammaproteobacteria bacterium]MCY4313556.1 dihydroorotase [Gammaproteobacteria bacterium]
MDISILNGHLIDPANGINQVMDIHISQDRIKAIGDPGQDFKPERVIDAKGRYIFPGIVDLCARLREPGEEHKATILSETRAAASAGITSLICPPDTLPVIETPGMVHMIQDRANAAGYSDIYPLGALTSGLKGEKLTDMATLQDAGCVGVSNALEPVENSLLMRRAMQYASTYDIPVFLASWDPWLQGNGVVHEGFISTLLGLPAIPEAAETVGVARDIALVETTGASAHILLISCEKSVSRLREARQRKLPITGSVAVHNLLCTESDIGEFNTFFKVIPPLRTMQDQEGLIQGLAGGDISVICSDHQPHSLDSKLAPFSEAATGIAGLDTLLTLAWSLARNGRLKAETVIAALTENPAQIAGLECGNLAVGKPADLLVFDEGVSWTLDNTTMMSRGRNSPWFGHELTGKVLLTIKGGKIVWEP